MPYLPFEDQIPLNQITPLCGAPFPILHKTMACRRRRRQHRAGKKAGMLRKEGCPLQLLERATTRLLPWGAVVPRPAPSRSRSMTASSLAHDSLPASWPVLRLAFPSRVGYGAAALHIFAFIYRHFISQMKPFSNRLTYYR
jgi:hypothetical protein